LIETERAGVDQVRNPDQIQARRASCCLALVIELVSRVREMGGGPAQVERVIPGQRRICVRNQTPARAGGKLSEPRPDPSHSSRPPEYFESLTEIVTAFILIDGLERGQLADAVRVAE
jgi:hypothetical protein